MNYGSQLELINLKTSYCKTYPTSPHDTVCLRKEVKALLIGIAGISQRHKCSYTASYIKYRFYKSI